MLFLIIIIGSEFGSYSWHRFGAHTDIIPGPHDTHRIHHTSNLTHEAHEDFFWVVFLLIVGAIGLTTIWYLGYYDMIGILPIYIIIAYSILILVFVWNWYIHSAYHIPNHWLNQYRWFQKDKRIHLQHHVNPRVNYGIASHFSDIIFGTYEYPDRDPATVFNNMTQQRRDNLKL